MAQGLKRMLAALAEGLGSIPSLHDSSPLSITVVPRDLDALGHCIHAVHTQTCEQTRTCIKVKLLCLLRGGMVRMCQSGVPSKGWFLPSTLWAPGIKTRLSSLAASAFTLGPSSLALWSTFVSIAT